MKQLTRRDVFIQFTKNLAQLSKCVDKKIAAVITDSDLTQIYSIGTNGGPKGGVDCLCTLGNKYTCIHAEVNALAKCKTTDTVLIMFIYSLYPCITCASLLINNNIRRLYVIDPLKRNEDSARILAEAGIFIQEVFSSGNNDSSN